MSDWGPFPRVTLAKLTFHLFLGKIEREPFSESQDNSSG